jgi:hypothetical protein
MARSSGADAKCDALPSYRISSVCKVSMAYYAEQAASRSANNYDLLRELIDILLPVDQHGVPVPPRALWIDVDGLLCLSLAAVCVVLVEAADAAYAATSMKPSSRWREPTVDGWLIEASPVGRAVDWRSVMSVAREN